MKLPPDVREATIEIAEDFSYYGPDSILNDGPREYAILEVYRLGALTIHRLGGEEELAEAHRVSHGATGVLVCDAADLDTAIAIARAADRAVDWSQITRTKDSIGVPQGWTAEMATALDAALKGFRRLKLDTPEWGFARG